MKNKKQNFHHKGTKTLRKINAFLCVFVSLWLFSFAGGAFASEFDNARQTVMSGQVESGAQMLARIVKTKPSPKALLLLGKTLDRLTDLFSERVEMACYWGRAREATPACAQAQAGKLNATYGAGAFKFVTDIAYVPYTGIHYRELLRRFPRSREADEAKFHLLLKDLVGHPSIVLPKVKSYLEKHSSGEANRKALLLWARVNEDMWYIHREWSWVIYNKRISPEDLIVKAEPYRQEAIRTFEKLISRYSKTFEARAARSELNLLKAHQYDGETYSILQDSVGGSPDKWGSEIPKPPLRATPRGIGEPGWQKPTTPVAPAPKPAPQAAPSAPRPAEPSGKKKETPKRWQ